jgi:hypothetical protein
MLSGCVTGVVIYVREWLDDDESKCVDFCVLDIDAQCGGETREHSVCMTTCMSSTEAAPCVEETVAMRECEAAMTCPEYRDRARAGGRCDAERAAHDACRSKADGDQ